MSNTKKYTENQALNSLKRKKDVKIDVNAKVIQIINGKLKKFPAKDDLGNSSHGKIDFLTKKCGYVAYKVSVFSI